MEMTPVLETVIFVSEPYLKYADVLSRRINKTYIGKTQ